MLSKGQIVKSKQRTEKYQLFLMVVLDPRPSSSQFNAVILKDFSNNEDVGYVANDWNTKHFELSGWDELKKFL